MNQTRIRRRSFRDLAAIDSTADFHTYALEHALGLYAAHCRERGRGLGSVLAIGANRREAHRFVHHPFDEILLTGLLESDDALREVERTDPRVNYRVENAECLSFPSRSYDLVFCKESLHHLARPVLGLYEMLRVCREAAILIEPYETWAGRILQTLGIATVYEKNQIGNVAARDNYVYRWHRRDLEALLASLYLESGYTLDLTLGWMSSRANGHRNPWIRRAAALCGWLLGWTPGSRGNYMTALITPGTNLPPDPGAQP